MSTTRQIAHNTIVQITGKILSTFLGLLAIGIMTRYLGQEQFGWYVTAITFLQFVGILIDFGLIPVTAQMLSEPHFDKKKLLKNLLGFRFVSAVLFLGLAPLAALLFPYPREVKIAISFTSLSFLAIAMNQVLVGYYQHKLSMHMQAMGEVIGRVFLIGGLWFVTTKGYGFLPVMTVVTLSSLVYTAVLWIHVYQKEKTGFSFEATIWKAIMTKMWPIAISIIFNVVYLKGDTIILSLFWPQETVGIYGAAYRVIDILAQTAMMLMGLMLPILAFNWSRNIKAEFKHRYQQAFDAMMMLAFPMLIGVLVLAKKIMVLVAGEEFVASGSALQILALAVFGVYLGAVFGHTAVAINKQKQTMWIYISDAVLTLIGYLIFIPVYGIMGAAWMTVFSELYAGLLLWIVIRHYSGVSLEMKTFSKIVFSSLVMGSALIILNRFNVLLLVLIAAAVYSLFLFGLDGISKKTMREIVSMRE
ncbi:MAG: flippase [Candidatus Magasanikbacteria bacterium]|nr:flippase [Candidatus Magasanikbacteria bacterium]